MVLRSSTRPSALERLSAVSCRTGLSRSEIYRRVAAHPPTFPRPIKIGARASAWSSAEVDAWIERRIAERDGALA
jgi:prophage regulatory protein